MPAGHADWGATLLEHVVPLHDRQSRAIALARQLEEAGHYWRPLVVLLTKTGDAVAGSDWIPVSTRGNGGCIVATAERSALVVVTERVSVAPIIDVPMWFVVKWRGSRIGIDEAGRWNDVNLGIEIQGVAVGDGTVWAGACYPASMTKPAGYRDTRLLIAAARREQVPEYRQTDVSCVHVSDPVPCGDEVYVLVTAGFERIELWAFDRSLSVRRVAMLEQRKNQRQTLGPARMVRCADSLVMVWGHFADRVGAKKPRTWQGALHAAAYDLPTKSTGPVVEATTDTRVVTATLQAHALGDSAALTWESRPQRGGGGMRAMRFASLDDLPRDAVALPDKSTRLFIPWPNGPILRAGRLRGSPWAVQAELPPL